MPDRSPPNSVRRRPRASWLLAAWLPFAASAHADGTVPTDAGARRAAPPGLDVALNLHRFTLDNGLRVVINENHAVPTVAVAVTYDVGARNEEEGRTGFAHLFEHMMFQGTRNVPKGGHFELITRHGGSANGTTSPERTNYFETLPAQDLETALWLEAERMQSLAVTPENFENQRLVVQEEYRMRISNQAYGRGWVRLRQLAYQGYWSYEHATLGEMADLDGARVEWVREFYDHYYAPNNAVLSISGDVTPEEARRLVELHFASLAQREVPTYVAPPGFPRQTSERLSVISDSNAKTPGAFHGWQIPPMHTPEHYALELAAFVLAEGESSRLYESLVIERASALRVSAGTWNSRGPDLFVVHIESAPASHLDRAQEALDGELKRLRLIGPSAGELEKAKEQMRFQFLRQLESNQGVALALGEYETYWGDANGIRSELGKYDAVTTQDIKSAATRYLDEHRRSIVEVYPPGAAQDEPPEVIRRTHIVSKGETLTSIAIKYGSTVYKITMANGINAKAALQPGQKLVVPIQGRLPVGKAAGPTVDGSAKAAAPAMRQHVVKTGENLGLIARRYQTTVGAIAAENGLDTKKPLSVGKTLAIPAAQATAPRAPTATKSTPATAKSPGTANPSSTAKPTDTAKPADTAKPVKTGTAPDPAPTSAKKPDASKGTTKQRDKAAK